MFFKNAKRSNISVESDRNVKSSKNFQYLGFFGKRDRFFKKTLGSFQNSLKVANLPWIATEMVRFFKTFKTWGFKTNGIVLRNVFGIAKTSKFPVDFD